MSTPTFIRYTAGCATKLYSYQTNDLSSFALKNVKSTAKHIPNSQWFPADAANGKYLGIYGSSTDQLTGYVIVFDIAKLVAYFNGPVLVVVADSITPTTISTTSYNGNTPISATLTVGSTASPQTFPAADGLPSETGVPILWAQLPSGDVSLSAATGTVPGVWTYGGSNKIPVFAQNANANSTVGVDQNIPYVTLLNTGFSVWTIILLLLVLLVIIAIVVGAVMYYKKRKNRSF